MLHSEKTAYVLASILIAIMALIVFCCCRIWYDLLGCGERRRGQRGAGRRGGGGAGNSIDGDAIVSDHEESRFKGLTNSGEGKRKIALNKFSSLTIKCRAR